MTIETNIYDKIIDVINESHKNKEKQPKIRERQSFEIVGGETICWKSDIKTAFNIV